MIVKLTGDVNIPEGKITFFGKLDLNMTMALGYIHLAETGYSNPYY